MDIALVDAFDLPDWLGTESVVWRASSALQDSAQVAGMIEAADGRAQVLDLLAVDAAYPAPVCPEKERSAVHQAWQFGEVMLMEVDGRLTAGAPGTRFDADRACEVVRRVARSVGAASGNVSVAITV